MYASGFSRNSYLNPLTNPRKCSGYGWYQEEVKETIFLKTDSVITIPANVKHWYGASKNSWLSLSPSKCWKKIPQMSV